jgi:hypothetical protein
VPAAAGDKITVGQAFPLATALRNLDGHMVVVKQNGVDNTIMVPWDFGSGAFRLRIANNLAILDAVQKAVDDSRIAVVKEIIKKSANPTATEVKPGTPEFDELQRQYGEMMNQPANGTQDLSRIKASELKLDRNEIPVTVISALKPILEDDVSVK